MSDVTYLEKTVKVPKETSEVFDAIVSIVKDVKAKKSISEISTGNLPKLTIAVDGWDQLDDEAAARGFVTAVALGAGEILDALKDPE